MAIIRKTLSSGRVIRKRLVTKGRVGLGRKRACQTGLNDGVTTLGDYVFGIETDRMLKRSLRKARKVRIQKYLEKTADFQLYRGNVPFGKVKSMMGKEAWDLNRRYEDTFYRSKDTDARLWRWYPVSDIPQNKRVSVAEYQRLRLAAAIEAQRKYPSKG